jgi:hypothetical protein
MAKKKAAANRHKEIERSTDDPFERAARVQEETSNDGKFSTYERVSTPNPEDADLILQWRGAPEEGK